MLAIEYILKLKVLIELVEISQDRFTEIIKTKNIDNKGKLKKEFIEEVSIKKLIKKFMKKDISNEDRYANLYLGFKTRMEEQKEIS